MGQWDKALIYYEKVLGIELNSTTSNDRSLATAYKALGSIHEKLGIHSKSLEFDEKASSYSGFR
jgi:tetratricopeptide (TPR) repeat protein